MVRPLPIGVQDFKEVRDEGYLYVDKSNLIPQILSQKSEVYQVTRPRRFGKSLNLSMLDAFFNIKYPKDNKWFDGLKVSGCKECYEHKNAYPVIYLDFKNLGVSNMKTFDSDLIDEMSNLFRNHKYLLDSEILDDVDKKYFDDVFRRKLDPITLRKSVSVLSRMLNEHHGRKVIILIDEYDNPIHNAFGKTHHQEILDSMRDILSSALKGNDSLQFGVVTGVMQIAKESIFSGLNNLKVNNVLSKDFDELFGFTDEEVKAILEEYGHPERIDEAREWYDGYRFGDADVYNPWSLLNYVSERFEPKPYWAGTSGNSILEDLFEYASPELWDEFRSLSEGMSIPYKVKPTITFQDLHTDERNIYSMLVMSGYLTAFEDDGIQYIRIPNGEMADVFGSTILNRLNVNSPMHVRNLSKAFVSGDSDAVEKRLYNLFASSAGNAMLNDEHSYQAFVTGMLMFLNGRYTVKADLEEGNGRFDIRLERRYGDYPNIVIEIKRIPIDSSDEAAETSAMKALEQIKKRDYLHGLEGPTLIYGIAFRNKKPTVLSERMDIQP
ncbi:MAG: AAA family ATPase [Candidatus Methanomethylophilaceae archaeon]|nr:AAA family ATPase [Candidatus Methanomethylophilaceae archaeon]